MVTRCPHCKCTIEDWSGWSKDDVERAFFFESDLTKKVCTEPTRPTQTGSQAAIDEFNYSKEARYSRATSFAFEVTGSGRYVIRVTAKNPKGSSHTVERCFYLL
jgi:hypothetical protein